MAKNKLQEEFPLIRTREEILAEIKEKDSLKNIYNSWEKTDQEKFLDMLTGARGVKILYDSYFKIVFDPKKHPDRLERLLSLLLRQKVKIIDVLPIESVRIADEGTLLIMDIVVKLEDGRIANIECQKIGYAFPGQRAACYSADLLMRQYHYVKKQKAEAPEEKDRRFSYNDIKDVFTIVFYEKSPREFKKVPEAYVHYGRQTIDTGVELNLLQKYVFITLDSFFKIYENKEEIKNELDAWIMFLGTDKPERILNLLKTYPKFKQLYTDVYTICRDTERVMNMFSEELKILDRNTVTYMIDEMGKEIEEKDKKINEQSQQINEQSQQINEQSQQINEQSRQINEQSQQIEEQKRQLCEAESRAANTEAEIARLRAALAAKGNS